MDNTTNNKQDSKVGEDGDDSDKSEHSVDAIHLRFQSDVYVCVTCKQIFEKKSKLKEHFENECRTVCSSCLKPMYIRKSVCGIEHGHICRKGVKHPNSHFNIASQPLSNHQSP